MHFLIRELYELKVRVVLEQSLPLNTITLQDAPG